MKNDFIIVIDQDENLTMIPFNAASQIRVHFSEYGSFELVWISKQFEYILYESKDVTEINLARDYVYERMLAKAFLIDLSTGDWKLSRLDLD